MSLKVNGDDFPFRENLSIEDILREKKYTYALKTVFLNGVRVPPMQYPSKKVADGDEVQVIHLMSGG